MQMVYSCSKHVLQQPQCTRLHEFDSEINLLSVQRKRCSYSNLSCIYFRWFAATHFIRIGIFMFIAVFTSPLHMLYILYGASPFETKHRPQRDRN